MTQTPTTRSRKVYCAKLAEDLIVFGSKSYPLRRITGVSKRCTPPDNATRQCLIEFSAFLMPLALWAIYEGLWIGMFASALLAGVAICGLVTPKRVTLYAVVIESAKGESIAVSHPHEHVIDRAIARIECILEEHRRTTKPAMKAEAHPGTVNPTPHSLAA